MYMSYTICVLGWYVSMILDCQWVQVFGGKSEAYFYVHTIMDCNGIYILKAEPKHTCTDITIISTQIRKILLYMALSLSCQLQERQTSRQRLLLCARRPTIARTLRRRPRGTPPTLIRANTQLGRHNGIPITIDMGKIDGVVLVILDMARRMVRRI